MKQNFKRAVMRKMNKISYDHADLTFHIFMALMKQMALMLAVFVVTTIIISFSVESFDFFPRVLIVMGAILVPFVTAVIFYAYFRVTESSKLKTETKFKENQNA